MSGPPPKIKQIVFGSPFRRSALSDHGWVISDMSMDPKWTFRRYRDLPKTRNMRIFVQR